MTLKLESDCRRCQEWKLLQSMLAVPAAPDGSEKKRGYAS